MRAPPTWAAGLLAVVSLGAACEGSEPRAAPPADGGVLAPGRLGTCADPVVLEGRDGETSAVTLDTTGGPPGRALLEIGYACALDPTDDVPQAVVAYRVPGEGPRTVRFSTDGEGTDARFLTAVVVRRDGCGGSAPDGLSDGCFLGGSSSGASHASGAVAARGGDVLVFVISGSRFLTQGTEDTYEGVVRLEVTAVAAAPPELHSAVVRVFPSGPGLVRVDVDGSDPDGDAAGVRLRFLDASKAPVAWAPSRGAGALGAAASFVEPPATPEPFTRVVTFDRPPEPVPAEAWVELFDAAGRTSERASSTVIAAQWRALGEPCDDVGLVCRTELACSDDTCGPAPAVVAACAAARPVELPPPDAVVSAASFAGTLAAGPGRLLPSCTEGSGTEALFTVVVPDAPVDLVLADQADGFGRTALWIRRSCVDGGSELGCSRMGDETRRRVLELRDAAPGTYVVAIDQFPLAASERTEEVPYVLLVGLRPVLETGHSCDPAGWDNRCRTGSCSAGTARCP